MKFRMDTYYRKQDKQGNSIACLKVYMESANHGFRDQVAKAVRDAIGDGKPKPEEKSSAIGFDTSPHGPDES